MVTCSSARLHLSEVKQTYASSRLMLSLEGKDMRHQFLWVILFWFLSVLPAMAGGIEGIFQE